MCIRDSPSVVMWGIFSLGWQRGDDVTPDIRELHTALKRVEPSRPTVALSNQDGELNTITDLIALKQNVGWMRGTTDDVGYWCETLHKSWGNLLAAPCYGVPGYPSQQDDLLGRPTPGTHLSLIHSSLTACPGTRRRYGPSRAPPLPKWSAAARCGTPGRSRGTSRSESPPP